MTEPDTADRRAEFLTRLNAAEDRQDAAAGPLTDATNHFRQAAADLRAAAADLRAVTAALRQLLSATPGTD